MELKKTARIDLLKERMLSQPRYVSMEQAMIITRATRGMKRSRSF